MTAKKRGLGIPGFPWFLLGEESVQRNLFLIGDAPQLDRFHRVRNHLIKVVAIMHTEPHRFESCAADHRIWFNYQIWPRRLDGGQGSA